VSGTVIDASVVASWLLPDEAMGEALAIYERLPLEAAYVPTLWDFEIRNILIVNERRGRINSQAVDAALGLLADLNIRRDAETDWDMAVSFSRQFSLTIYDAAYLELAVRIDLPLATFDKALASAAARLGKLAPETPRLKP